MEQSCPRKVERCIGMLESLRTKPGDCFARVRVGEDVFHLPLSQRGVLQPDGKTIKHCINGDRYHPISPTTPIAVDLVYDVDNKNPYPGLWAPKR
jgi:hypothetical protein